MRAGFKLCKGINKALGFDGCGKTMIAAERKYGLCPKCLWRWTQETDTGAEWFKAAQERNRKHQQEAKARQWRKQKQDIKRKLMSVNAIRSQKAQPIFNRIIRMIDSGHPCIASGVTRGQFHAGHFFHAGGNVTLALNAHNVHKQHSSSNNHLSGDLLRYREGLMVRYGEDYLTFLEGLKSCPPIKVSKDQMWDVVDMLKEAEKEFEKVINTHSKAMVLKPKDMIELRNELNLTLGIYPEKYAIFKAK